jgi:hypothetical protein
VTDWQKPERSRMGKKIIMTVIVPWVLVLAFVVFFINQQTLIENGITREKEWKQLFDRCVNHLKTR